MKKYLEFILEQQDNIYKYGDRVLWYNNPGTIIGYSNPIYLVEFDNKSEGMHVCNGIKDVWSGKYMDNAGNGNCLWLFADQFTLLEPEDQFEDWEDINEGRNYKFKLGDRVIIYQHFFPELRKKIGTIVELNQHPDQQNGDNFISYRIKTDKPIKYSARSFIANKDIPSSVWVEEKDLSLYDEEPEDQFEDWEDINEGNDYEFQVGDKVIFTDCEGGRFDRLGATNNLDWARTYLTKENIYTVSDYNAKWHNIKFEDDPKGYGYNSYQFKLAEPEETEDQFEEWEDINEDIFYDQQLIKAAKEGKLDMVKQAIDYGADVHVDNDCALGRASLNGYLNIVEYLVEHGANIHANKGYSLGWASLKGHLDVVKYLIEQGANIHAEDDYSLRWAFSNGHLNVVKYLIEYIIENEPEYIDKITMYLPDVPDLQEKYPWVYAGRDHGLLGFKRNLDA